MSNLFIKLEQAVECKKSYGELLKIVEEINKTGVPVKNIIKYLMSIYDKYTSLNNDYYEDELGDLIMDLEWGKHNNKLKKS